MKKYLFLLLLLLPLGAIAQNAAIDSARAYINAYITTNGAKTITGAKLNTALLRMVKADSVNAVTGEGDQLTQVLLVPVSMPG
jgi:hypothetical protein